MGGFVTNVTNPPIFDIRDIPCRRAIRESPLRDRAATGLRALRAGVSLFGRAPSRGKFNFESLHSTVTDFARFRGLSISQPRCRAT